MGVLKVSNFYIYPRFIVFHINHHALGVGALQIQYEWHCLEVAFSYDFLKLPFYLLLNDQLSLNDNYDFYEAI